MSVEVLEGALRSIREICRTAKDEESALRKIDQIVGFAFKRAGIEAGPEQPEEAEKSYILNLGPLQMEGSVDATGIARGILWLNGTRIDAQGVDVQIRGNEPVIFDLVGVGCHEPR